MSISVNNVNKLGQYPNGDISKLDAFTLGTMIVPSEGTGATYEEARNKARANACRKADEKSRANHYPFVLLQDQMPQTPGQTVVSLESIVQNNGVWTATTNEIDLSFDMYKRKALGGVGRKPHLVTDTSQVPGFELKIEDSIFGGEKYLYRVDNTQTLITGKAVGTNPDIVTVQALSNARKAMRNYALSKAVSFEIVPAAVLGDMTEICYHTLTNNIFNVRMEKGFNVYGLKPKSTIFA